MPEKINILLIDDDFEDFLVTKSLIEDIPGKKHQINWSGSYHEGLQAIIDDQYTVYLIDFQLGAKNGLELINEAVNYGCTSPLILLTGLGDPEIDIKATKAGAADYLVKGTFNSQTLERSIRYSLQHSQNLGQIQKLNANLEKRVEDRTKELEVLIRKLEYTNSNLEKEIQERKAIEEALLESQQLYSTIAHNFPNGIISIVDTSLTFVFLDGMELIESGLKQEHISGKKIFEIIDPQFHSMVETNLEPVFKGDKVSFEVTFNDQYYQYYAVPFPDARGRNNHILMVIQNITEQKKAEVEIRKSLDKEIELNELKSRFVTLASHEFRTPLSTILSSVTLLARYNQPDMEEKRHKHIQRIKSSVNNLTNILNDFLSISKLDEGKIEVNKSMVSIDTLCEEIIEEIHAVTKEGQVITKNTNTNGLMMEIDKQIFKNVLLNLLSNAVKYSPEYSNIKLKIEKRSNQLVIEVADDGIGIPEQDQIHLFSRFFRAKNAVNIQGTGLGLHIVKKYIDLLDGSLNFESVQNKGTTFYITIPI